MKKKITIIVTIVIIIITISGIIITQQLQKEKDLYTVLMYEFYDLYFEVAISIDDNSNDMEIALSLLSDSKNQEKIMEMEETLIEMRSILNNMKQIPKNKISNINKLEKWHNEMKLISNSKYLSIMDMPIEERSKVGNILMAIRYRLADWEDKDSNVAWEW